MAVTVGQLGVALRVVVAEADLEAAQTAVLTRCLNAATAAIAAYQEDAPAAMVDQGAVMLAGWFYDRPNAPESDDYADALAGSGVAALLEPWSRDHANDASLRIIGAALALGQAPDAEEGLRSRAVNLYVEYMLEAPPGQSRANAWQNSGAAQVLAPFVDHSGTPV